MKVKSRGIAIIMTLVIGLSLLFSITGCGDDDDPLGLATLELTSSNSIHYARQGSIHWVGVRCQPEDYGPDKPVYVWNISYNGSFVEEIVHDTKPPDTSDTSGESNIVDDDLWMRGQENRVGNAVPCKQDTRQVRPDPYLSPAVK